MYKANINVKIVFIHDVLSQIFRIFNKHTVLTRWEYKSDKEKGKYMYMIM